MTGATATTATTAGGSNSKFSSKLKGLKFMQRAQEKKTGNDEKETKTTTTTTTARTTTTTNDEHWTYENPEQYERARKQKALKEQLASLREKKTMSSPQWVFGRRSFGGFNKAIEAMAREQEERQMKAKLAIRDARNSKVDKKKKKNKMSSKKSTTTATNRKKK
jgi:hypothetical protein